MGIREVRRSRDITQKQLAEVIGVGVSVISKYEKGIITPPSDKLKRIADFLGVSVDRLLDEKTEVRKENSVFKRNDIEKVELDRFDIMQFAVSRKVLSDAGGICELCGNKAPFHNKNGEPYLEAHFIHWLSEGGRPTLDNVVALCPNCHKRIHVLHKKEDMQYLQKVAFNHGMNKTINVDYIIDDGKKEFLIEYNDNSPRCRLLEYYSSLIKKKSELQAENRQIALNKLIEGMSDKEVEQRISGFEIIDKDIINTTTAAKLTPAEEATIKELEELLGANETVWDESHQ